MVLAVLHLSLVQLIDADYVSLLAEMLDVLVLALTVMQEEASTFGLPINWSKTKSCRFPLPPLSQQSRWQMDMLK